VFPERCPPLGRSVAALAYPPPGISQKSSDLHDYKGLELSDSDRESVTVSD
jgi:hypothetical protein